MPVLSICLPSNRPLKTSRMSIESALDYAEAVDGQLILSDNSRDPEKRAYFENRSPRLIYRVPPTDEPMLNMMTALACVDTPFLMPMGDDDEIFLVEGETHLDLATLPAEFIGVRPQTQIWTRDCGVLHTERFTIDADRSADRILEYNQKARGNNTIYYSIFRSNCFIPLVRLFDRAHPTRGSYCDWALCFALFASGKMACDPATLYRYDLGRWAHQETVDAAKLELYRMANLPDVAERFSALLTFVDLHVFLLLSALPMAPEDRAAALVMNCRITLSTFLRTVREEPQAFDETSRYLSGLIEESDNVDVAFQVSVMLMDQIQPGLKDRYVRFYQETVAA